MSLLLCYRINLLSVTICFGIFIYLKILKGHSWQYKKTTSFTFTNIFCINCKASQNQLLKRKTQQERKKAQVIRNPLLISEQNYYILYAIPVGIQNQTDPSWY